MERHYKIMTPKLEKEDFIEQITKHGYFAEQFPSCFTSKIFADKIKELLPLEPCTKNQQSKPKLTLPSTVSMRKDNFSRRVLSLPNPEAFLRLVKLMQENWVEIQQFTKSENSLSPITYIHKYDEYVEKAMLNSENVRDSIQSKSDFVKGLRNCIKTSLGYKYRLKVDIAICYYSIYTHSIAWAMCGKEEAKKYLRTQEPKSLRTVYELADKLDTFIRYQKNNETNGIVVGPFSSRIFSEIILAAIDRKLTQKNFVFRRYVDDYKFYFRSDTEAKGSIQQIEKILNEFGLHLNTSKTEINCFPYEIKSNMKEIYQESLKNDGVFGVFNSASQLYLDGEKGAYKYALKLIRNETPKPEDLDIIMSFLMNILLIEPKYGKYVVNYLKENIYRFEKEKVMDLVNRELDVCIGDELQQETLVFLYMIKELDLSLRADNLINILNCSNDFAIIIGLDIWKNRKKTVEKTNQQAKEIKESIKILTDGLLGEKYSGSRWLLLHEIKMHGLVDYEIMPKPSNDVFFNKLYSCKVTFYKSICDKLC